MLEGLSFDANAIAEELRANVPDHIIVRVEPSPVQESPHDYVFAYLTRHLEDGPQVVISDGAEVGLDLALVGTRPKWEAGVTEIEEVEYANAVDEAQRQLLEYDQQ